VPSERRTPTPDLDDRVVRTALMSLPSASVLLVDKDMRYRAAVGAAVTYYGFEPTKMIGRLVSDTLSPETFLFVEPALRRALAGEMFTEIREIKLLGGAAFEMAYGPAVEDGEIVGAMVVVRDVTVEHRAFSDLTATGELHHMLMSQTSDVIALTTPAESRYTWVSPSAARVLGWEYHKLVGRTVYDFVHPEDVEAVRAARSSLLGDHEQASVTFRYRRPSGGFIWIEGQIRRLRDADGAITGLLSTLRDITERKRLEAELSRARTSFELAFSAAPIGMSLVSVDGRFLRVNDALCKLLGRDQDSLLRLTFRDITHPDDLGDSNELLKSMLDGTAGDGRL
jgi:PAS domain S-box-containing protein